MIWKCAAKKTRQFVGEFSVSSSVAKDNSVNMSKVQTTQLPSATEEDMSYIANIRKNCLDFICSYLQYARHLDHHFSRY